MNSEYIYVYFQLLKDTFSNIYKTAVVKESERAAGEWITTQPPALSPKSKSVYFFNSLCKVCFFMYGLYFINSILCELFLRFFCVMYRLIPCTPASLCSVHSNVTCNRTSFFFEAAMTCKAPLLEDVDVFAEEENAEVDTREDKIDWESAFISLFMHAIKPKDDIKEEEEDDVCQ